MVTPRLLVLLALSVVLLIASASVIRAEVGDQPGQGLAFALANAADDDAIMVIVGEAMREGVDPRVIAFAMGRASANVNSSEPTWVSLGEGFGDVPQDELANAFLAGTEADEVMRTGRGPFYVPLGGSGGAAGGRNE